VESILGVNDARCAGQRSRYREARDRSHSMSGGGDFSSVDSSSCGGSGGGYNGADSDDDEPNGAGSASVDLSSFAFVDLDRGAVDVAVPPPPFPAAAVRALQRSVRAITKPNLSRHDEIAAAHCDAAVGLGMGMGMGSGRSGQSAASNDAAAAVAAQAPCNGGNFHLHYHPSSSPEVSERSTPQSASHQPHHPSPFVTTHLPSSDAEADGESESSTAEEQVHSLSRSLDRSLRVCFLQFLASLIDKYRDFLFFARGATPVFDTPAYLLTLRGPRADALPFLSRFLETQIVSTLSATRHAVLLFRNSN